MPTRASVTTFKIRLRPELKRRLEREAKRSGKSINIEMVDRLEQSFEQRDLKKLGSITSDLENVLKRYARTGEDHRRSLQGDLLQAVEDLIKRFPTSVATENAAVARVQKAVTALANETHRLQQEWDNKENNK